MADIDVVPKRKSGSAWLWIVLAIVAVLIVMWMVMGANPSDVTSPATSLMPGYELAELTATT